MPTVVVGEVPTEEFALRKTLEEVPGAEFECERVVESADEVVMPLVWARDANGEELHGALQRDPSVRNLTRLADRGDEWLYRMDWVRQVQLVLRIILQTKATVLDAYGDSGGWNFRILYPEHDEFSTTSEFCRDHDLTFEIKRVRTIDEEPTSRYGLTREQYEALRVAWERGYFDVPRQVDIETLADELDISHQALSERLRRGHSTLIRETLGVIPQD